MPEPKHRWSSPAAWLESKIQEHIVGGHTIALATIIRRIKPKLFDDTIQELFESEMDEDGFFNPIEPEESP